VTPDQSEFVEEMGQYLASSAIMKMVGGIGGGLFRCLAYEQTAAEIAEALQASRGAISGTARILSSAGMIRRTTRRGDRREYFSAPPEALDSMLRSASSTYRRLREIAERGLAASTDQSPSARARLEEFRDVIGFIERELPFVIDRFFSERAGTTDGKDIS